MRLFSSIGFFSLSCFTVKLSERGEGGGCVAAKVTSNLIKEVVCFSTSWASGEGPAPSSWHIRMFSSPVRLAGSSSPLILSLGCCSHRVLLLRACSQLLMSSMTMWAGTSAAVWGSLHKLLHSTETQADHLIRLEANEHLTQLQKSTHWRLRLSPRGIQMINRWTENTEDKFDIRLMI